MTPRNRTDRRLSVRLESLEGRTVLATSGGPVVPINIALVHALSYLDLQGSAHGSTATVVGNPDVGTTVKLLGSGTVSSLGTGPIKVAGSIHGTGFLAGSHVEGSITLVNTKGSFTLQLQSPTVGGFTAPRSGTYTFVSTSGTKAFKKDFGIGTINLVLKHDSFALTFHSKPNIY